MRIEVFFWWCLIDMVAIHLERLASCYIFFKNFLFILDSRAFVRIHSSAIMNHLSILKQNRFIYLLVVLVTLFYVVNAFYVGKYR